MGSYQEDCLERKAVRAGIVEQKPLKTRNKRPRPFIVECLSPGRLVPSRRKPSQWKRWGSYRTFDEADAALKALARKYSFTEWRHKPYEST